MGNYIFGSADKIDERRLWTPAVGTPGLLLGWRALCWAFHFCTFTALWATVGGDEVYRRARLGYLTHLTHFVTMLYFFFALVTNTVAFTQSKKKSWLQSGLGSSKFCSLWRQMTYLQRTFYSITLPLNLVITFMYWQLLYKGDNTTNVAWARDIFVHALPLVTTTLDLLLSRSRAVDTECLLIVVYGILYAVDNALVTKHLFLVYSILPWTGPGSYILVIGLIIVAVILHFLYGWLATARDRLYPASWRKDERQWSGRQGAAAAGGAVELSNVVSASKDGSVGAAAAGGAGAMPAAAHGSNGAAASAGEAAEWYPIVHSDGLYAFPCSSCCCACCPCGCNPNREKQQAAAGAAAPAGQWTETGASRTI